MSNWPEMPLARLHWRYSLSWGLGDGEGSSAFGQGTCVMRQGGREGFVCTMFWDPLLPCPQVLAGAQGPPLWGLISKHCGFSDLQG